MKFILILLAAMINICTEATKIQRKLHKRTKHVYINIIRDFTIYRMANININNQTFCGLTAGTADRT